jgi:cyclopropane fatty-acyl-phospholipid synthase-like methyltransferase
MVKDLWDARFSGKEYVYGTEPNRFYQSQLGLLKPGRLLLPGEGEERNAVWAASKGWSVDAIDFSRSARDKAQALAKSMKVTLNSYVVADLLQIQLPLEAYDAVAEVFVHLPSEARRHWHTKLVQCLRPGGIIIIESYHVKQLDYGTGGPQNSDMLHTAELLKSDFPGFDFLLLDETEDVLNEGSLHNGPSALVRMVAQKC